MASLHHQKMKHKKNPHVGFDLLAPSPAQLPYPYQKKPVYVSNPVMLDLYGRSDLYSKAEEQKEKRSSHAEVAQHRDGAQRRAVNAPNKADIHSTPYSLQSEDITLDNSEGGAGQISTSGQAMYIIDNSEEASRDPNNNIQPLWQKIGFTGEDYEDYEEHAADADVDWVMTKGRRSVSPHGGAEAPTYDPRRPGSPADMVLHSIEADQDQVDPFSETYRTSEAYGSSRRDFNDTGDIALVGAFERTGDSEDFNGFKKPDLSIDISGKDTERKSRKTTPKFYSWAGNYKSPPRTPSNKAPSPKRPKQQPIQQTDDDKLFKRRYEQEKEFIEKELKVLMNRSQPYFKAPESIMGGSAAHSQSIDTGKKSLKGLTKHEFKPNAIHSPYLEHVKNPKAINELHRLHQEIFKKKYTKIVPPEGMVDEAKQDLKANTPKGFALIHDDKVDLAGRPSSNHNNRKPAPRELSPVQLARQLETMKFLSISAKVAENKKHHVIRVERPPDDLYVQTQMYMKQLGPPRSSARMMSKGGHVHPAANVETAITNATTDDANLMQSGPSSPTLLRRTPSPTQDALKLNNIDRLVTDQVVPIIHPQASKHFQQQQLQSQPQLPSSPTTKTPPDFMTPQGTAGEISHESKLDAIEMLANIHIDPLYRIIREEIERMTTMQHAQGIVQTAMQETGPPLGQTILPANNRIRMKLNPSTVVNVSDVKVLSYFQSLPPAIWVTSRIVYFLIMAFFETVILKVENLEYRKALQLEVLWEILSRHYDKEQLNVFTISRQFSWPYLQELMKHPVAFIKLLDVLEHGLYLDSAEAWNEFQEKVHNSLQNFNATTSLPIKEVMDQESSQSLFLDVFPVVAFQPLREMVKAARGFLLNNSTVLYNGSSYGSPLVPGSPLAISSSLTSWCKRVIAMLYMAGTYRVKLLKSKGIQATQAMQEYVDSPKIIDSSNTSGDQAGLTTQSSSAQQAVKPAMLLPPCVAFTTVLDSTSYYFTERQEQRSTPQGLSEGSIPYFLQTAYALIKPSDVLEVMFSDYVERSGGGQRDCQVVKSDLEQFLRMTSASPLHRVNLLDDQSNSQEMEKILVGDTHQIFNQLHPILKHYLLQKYHPISYEQGRRLEQVDMLITEMRCDFNKPLLPMIPIYAHDIAIDRSRYSVESWINDPYIKLSSNEVSLGDIVRDQLNCSLGLITDQISTENMMMSGDRYTSGLRSYRYVVCVQDTINSWNAFQLACKLAKESDTIQLVHVPTINFHMEYSAGSSSASQQIADKREKTLRRPLSCLTMAEYQVLLGEAIERKNKVVTLYKSLGYNVLCDKIPSYLEVASRVLENYSCMMRYYRKIPQNLGNEYAYHPIRSFQFLQYNQELRNTSQRLLKLLTPLQPDFIILGADNQDVYNGLACSFSQDYLSFSCKDATLMTLDEYPYSIKVHQQSSPNAPSQLHPHPSHQQSSKAADAMSIGKESNYGADESLGLFEEKAVLLAEQNSQANDLENDAYTPPDVDAYENESFADAEEASQSNQANASSEQLTPNVKVSVPPQQYQQPVINPSTFNDYEIDSFIVEDNDEGENSLTASPLLRRQSDPANQSITNSEVNSYQRNLQDVEDHDTLISHLHTYLAYSRQPTTFVETLINETSTGNQNMYAVEDGSKKITINTSQFSFILANIPVRYNNK